MPEAVDPMASVGYLIAAGAATVVGIGGYALLLWRWIREARVRRARLQAPAAPGPAPVGPQPRAEASRLS
ncbi:MAG TPA: hypothetical protein VFC51_07220 [Chloroflexota bacterium]|nr:hypothetical protein [Chloroflexota bacterium]